MQQEEGTLKNSKRGFLPELSPIRAHFSLRNNINKPVRTSTPGCCEVGGPGVMCSSMSSENYGEFVDELEKSLPSTSLVEPGAINPTPPSVPKPESPCYVRYPSGSEQKHQFPVLEMPLMNVNQKQVSERSYSTRKQSKSSMMTEDYSSTKDPGSSMSTAESFLNELEEESQETPQQFIKRMARERRLREKKQMRKQELQLKKQQEMNQKKQEEEKRKQAERNKLHQERMAAIDKRKKERQEKMEKSKKISVESQRVSIKPLWKKMLEEAKQKEQQERMEQVKQAMLERYKGREVLESCVEPRMVQHNDFEDGRAYYSKHYVRAMKERGERRKKENEVFQVQKLRAQKKKEYGKMVREMSYAQFLRQKPNQAIRPAPYQPLSQRRDPQLQDSTVPQSDAPFKGMMERRRQSLPNLYSNAYGQQPDLIDVCFEFNSPIKHNLRRRQTGGPLPTQRQSESLATRRKSEQALPALGSLSEQGYNNPNIEKKLSQAKLAAAPSPNFKSHYYRRVQKEKKIGATTKPGSISQGKEKEGVWSAGSSEIS
mmetsp:Transcript_17810/g.23076  ORF Transcript_17810/g.23076 Transcript_17810/m.23076 type:complete len:543 (-) Transcript_17810:564-2192(-)